MFLMFFVAFCMSFWMAWEGLFLGTRVCFNDFGCPKCHLKSSLFFLRFLFFFLWCFMFVFTKVIISRGKTFIFSKRAFTSMFICVHHFFMFFDVFWSVFGCRFQCPGPGRSEISSVKWVFLLQEGTQKNDIRFFSFCHVFSSFFHVFFMCFRCVLLLLSCRFYKSAHFSSEKRVFPEQEGWRTASLLSNWHHRLHTFFMFSCFWLVFGCHFRWPGPMP